MGLRASLLSATFGLGLLTLGTGCSSSDHATDIVTSAPEQAATTALGGPEHQSRSPMTPPAVEPATSVRGGRLVSGTLVMSGGPYPPVVIPVPVEVRAIWIDGDAPPVTARAGLDGSFMLRLWDGRFQLLGSSPRYNDGVGGCFGREIVVDSDLTGVLIDCPMK